MITIKQSTDEEIIIMHGEKTVFRGMPWDFPYNAVGIRNFLIRLGMDVTVVTGRSKQVFESKTAKPSVSQGV